MRVVLTLVVAASLALSQSSEDLRRRYGKPVWQTFRVGPKIGVTVRYNVANVVVEMLIVPIEADNLHWSRHETLGAADVKDLLQKLVPRGRLLRDAGGLRNSRNFPSHKAKRDNLDMEVEFGLVKLAPEQMLAFRPSEDVQDHVETLMERAKDGTITESEQAELDYFVEFEHLLRLMKKRAAKILSTRSAA
jgi:hypothetical protein